MKNYRTFFLLVFVTFVLIFSVVTVLFWSFMTEHFLAPIYYFLWICGLVINSVPQGIYLAGLVILSIGMGWRTLGSVPINRLRQSRIYDQSNPNTRYQHWLILVTHAHGTWFSQNRFVSASRELILSILASEQGIDQLEAEKLVQNGGLDLPDILRDVIVSKHIPQPSTRRRPRLLYWLRIPARQRNTSSDLYVDQFLTALIDFAEYHLEITAHASNEFEA